MSIFGGSVGWGGGWDPVNPSSLNKGINQSKIKHYDRNINSGWLQPSPLLPPAPPCTESSVYLTHTRGARQLGSFCWGLPPASNPQHPCSLLLSTHSPGKVQSGDLELAPEKVRIDQCPEAGTLTRGVGQECSRQFLVPTGSSSISYVCNAPRGNRIPVAWSRKESTVVKGLP